MECRWVCDKKGYRAVLILGQEETPESVISQTLEKPLREESGILQYKRLYKAFRT